MANNCLQTKLKSIVQNNNLIKLGDIILTIKAGARLNDYIRYYSIEPLSMKILSGIGSFSSDETVTETTVPISWDEEKATVGVYSFKFYATTDCTISVSKKYKIKKYMDSYTLSINASDLVMLLNDTQIDHYWCCGVIGALDVSSLPSDTVIIGQRGYMYGSDVYGDVTSNLLNISHLMHEFFKMSKVTADVSQLPNVSNLEISGANSPLSWKTTRNHSYGVICFWNSAVDFGTDLDAMLINQANCQPTGIINPDKLKIMANGIKTSTSDAAVETLKGMGLTVIINGETL